MEERRLHLDYPPEGMEDVWRICRLKIIGRNVSLSHINYKCTLLDIGSNDCAVTNFLEKEKFEYIGFDISKKALERGKGRNRVLCDVCNLPIKNNVADIIICAEVLEHIENPDKLIHEIARVSKPNAKLLISTPNSEGLFSKMQKLLFTNHFHNWQNVEFHFQVYTPRKLDELLGNYGFKINRKIKSIAFPPFKMIKNKMIFQAAKLISKLIPPDLQELLIWVVVKAK